MKSKKIFSIFSKKRLKKEKEIPPIIADYREKNCLIPYELSSLGIKTEFRELKVGDYIAGDTVVERKTVADFISSMINRRLLNQLEELQQYQNKLLMIEGIEEHELYNDENIAGVNANAIRGFLLSITLRHRIPVIFTKNSEDSARYLWILAKKREKEIPLNAKKKNLDRKEQLQLVIEGFPGIGPKTAKKLLEKFGSIKEIINADEEELKKVLGKKAGIILEMRDRRY